MEMKLKVPLTGLVNSNEWHEKDISRRILQPNEDLPRISHQVDPRV